MIKSFKLTEKVDKLIKGIIYVLAVAALIYSVTSIVKQEGQNNTEKIVEQYKKESKLAQEERQKLNYEQFLLNKELQELQEHSNENKLLLQGMKKDYLHYFKDHQKLLQDEKIYITPTSYDEQSRIITSFKYEPF